jgi:hypothetical protein
LNDIVVPKYVLDDEYVYKSMSFGIRNFVEKDSFVSFTNDGRRNARQKAGGLTVRWVEGDAFSTA